MVIHAFMNPLLFEKISQRPFEYPIPEQQIRCGSILCRLNFASRWPSSNLPLLEFHCRWRTAMEFQQKEFHYHGHSCTLSLTPRPAWGIKNPKTATCAVRKMTDAILELKPLT